MGISIDIYEDTFVKNAVSSYNLSVLVGTDRFSFMAFDQDQQKVQLLKSYQFHAEKKQAIKTIVHEIYSQDSLLNNGFHQTSIAIVNEKNSLIPSRLYEENQENTYLRRLIDLPEEDVLLVNEIAELDIRNVFSIDTGLKNILHSYFPNAQLFHVSTLFIKGARELSKHRAGFQIYLNVIGRNFQIVLFENQDLVFSNIFSYKSANDFVYFLMLIFDQFKLKPEAIPLYLCGQITEDSEIYKLIYRYIRHIHFISLPHFLNFGPRLKNETNHHFFNLYCSKLCV